MAQLEIRNLTFKYPGAGKPVLDNLSLSVRAGEFVVLTGRTGSGKTTLLKIIKKDIAPYGELSGEILYAGIPYREIDGRMSAGEIGYVFQNPENQIVSDHVWSELAFGLENLGLPDDLIRRRVGETANFFGINNWFFRKTAELSSGETQLLCLASVIAMRPRLLLLDEPMARLDPTARERFLSFLIKINQELGITVLLVEHQLEDVLATADRVMVLESGTIAASAAPRAAAVAFSEDWVGTLPAAMRFFRATGGVGDCPISVKEGRDYLRRHFRNDIFKLPPVDLAEKEEVIAAKDLWFRYRRRDEDVIRGLRFSIKKGEIVAVLGGNGSGKTTLLKIIAGVYQPYRGKVAGKAKTALLPQNPEDLFLGPTVADDLKETEESRKWIRELSAEQFLSRNFYDLSGGEKQKAGLLRVLGTAADVLLLDEPTKGLDEKEKRDIAGILKSLRNKGVTSVVVTHDAEFAAEVSDRCALLFAGEIVAAGAPREFFSGNCFYTTASARIAQDYYQGVVTVGELVMLARENGAK
jgi:energy-coupling factor transporter ATP-binding protein EcfA2